MALLISSRSATRLFSGFFQARSSLAFTMSKASQSTQGGNNDDDDQVVSSFSEEEMPASRTGTGKSLNLVTLLGRLGVDPQLRGSTDKPVVVFSLATNHYFRPKIEDGSLGELVKKTDWHNIVVFKPFLRQNALDNFLKGTRALVRGRIMYGSVTDSAGNIRHTTSIVAEDLIKC